MDKQEMLSKKQIFIAFMATFLLWVVISIVMPGRSEAASITVAGVCTLDDAVASLNAGSDQSGCTGTGAYGADDTINVPSGTHSYLSTNAIEVDATIVGAGMGDTIIDLAGNNGGFQFDNTGATLLNAEVSDMSIINADGVVYYLISQGYDLSISRLEIYSENPSYSTDAGIVINNNNANIVGQRTQFEDIYIHDINTANQIMTLNSENGVVSSDNLVRNITISDVVAGSGVVAYGIAFQTSGAGGAGSTITGTVENVTMHNLDFLNPGAYFAAYSENIVGSGTNTINMLVRNSTTYLDQEPTASAVRIIPIVVAAPGGQADSTIQIQNNLFVADTSLTTPTLGCSSFSSGAGGTENFDIVSLGGNILEGNGCSAYATEPTDVNNADTAFDFLDPLQNNGGATPTMALLTGSPAIDAGADSTLAYDQRGVSRPQGIAYDSGAYELIADNDETDGSGGGEVPSELVETGISPWIIALSSAASITITTAAIIIARKSHIYFLR